MTPSAAADRGEAWTTSRSPRSSGSTGDHRRLHAALGHVPPAEHETQHHQQTAPAAPDHSLHGARGGSLRPQCSRPGFRQCRLADWRAGPAAAIVVGLAGLLWRAPVRSWTGAAPRHRSRCCAASLSSRSATTRRCCTCGGDGGWRRCRSVRTTGSRPSSTERHEQGRGAGHCQPRPHRARPASSAQPRLRAPRWFGPSTSTTDQKDREGPGKTTAETGPGAVGGSSG